MVSTTDTAMTEIIIDWMSARDVGRWCNEFVSPRIETKDYDIYSIFEFGEGWQVAIDMSTSNTIVRFKDGAMLTWFLLKIPQR